MSVNALGYTNPENIVGMVYDLNCPRNPNVMGYGNKIPTSYRVKWSDNRWRRIYAICYSNAASYYVCVDGKRLFIDIDTEYALSEGLSHPCVKG